jgi:hypothetical protein
MGVEGRAFLLPRRQPEPRSWLFGAALLQLGRQVMANTGGRVKRFTKRLELRVDKAFLQRLCEATRETIFTDPAKLVRFVIFQHLSGQGTDFSAEAGRQKPRHKLGSRLQVLVDEKGYEMIRQAATNAKIKVGAYIRFVVNRFLDGEQPPTGEEVPHGA